MKSQNVGFFCTKKMKLSKIEKGNERDFTLGKKKTTTQKNQNKTNANNQPNIIPQKSRKFL